MFGALNSMKGEIVLQRAVAEGLKFEGWMKGWIGVWMDGSMDGWTDGRTDGWMDGWMGWLDG